jgi:4-amino-4-deoxy-L-arabinose transferase-like glycosyltransferase
MGRSNTHVPGCPRRVLRTPSAAAQILGVVRTLAPERDPAAESAVSPSPGTGPRNETLGLTALLLGAGLLYLFGLSRNGWGNSFYAGAAQAGAQSWTAMFFGSSDAANSITVDKPPASLWLISLSIRIFGLSSWSVLVPQALMGVAAVALLTMTVRRVLGPWPGLLAGLLFAVTPVVTVLFRYDNPDALMTLLLVAAAYATTRAVEDGRTRWVVLTGALLGAAFLTKTLQAFLVLPGLALVLLVAAPGPVRRRVTRLLAGGAALLVSAGWWFVIVGSIPKGSRPWVGGSGTGNPVDLALGYNGLGRLLGQRSPSGKILVKGGSPWRLLGSAGDQVSWLIPAALIALVAAAVLTRRAGRTDPVRAAVLLWGGWAVVASIVLSVMQGIWHAYYTIELAPAYAALIAIGATVLWRRNTLRARATLAVGSVLTTGWSVSLIARHLPLVNPVSVAVVVLGIAAVVLLLPAPGRVPGTRERRIAAALAVLAAVVGPLAWSVATVVRPHAGPSLFAGPVRGSLLAPIGTTAAPPASPEALALLRADATAYTWTAATVGHKADDLQLAVGTPVMPVGGFAGDDPSPTLADFQAYVADGRIHWYVRGIPGTHTAAAIDAWVRSSAPVVHAGKTTLYDLSKLRTG